jgi:hypothetical protein
MIDQANMWLQGTHWNYQAHLGKLNRLLRHPNPGAYGNEASTQAPINWNHVGATALCPPDSY